MSQVIGQVWREVVGCRYWPVMRVPQFIAPRRNGMGEWFDQRTRNAPKYTIGLYYGILPVCNTVLYIYKIIRHGLVIEQM